MKFSHGTAPLLALMAGAASITPARAQFAGFTGNARYEATASQKAVPYGSLSLYPVAIFATGGRITDTVAGAVSDSGLLVAGDVGVKLPRTRSALEIGGWYWNKGSSDLYQIQGRAFLTPQIGLQLSYIGSTNKLASGHTYSGFVVYDLTSQQFARRARPRWSVEFGLGLLRDVSAGQDTSDFSFFVSGSVEIAPRISINASQWYLRDRSADLNRFALGLGFSF